MSDTTNASRKSKNSRLTVDFAEHFPLNLVTTRESVTPSLQFVDGKPGDQERDPITNLPVWNFRAWDPDPAAPKGQGELNVKIMSQFSPELPAELPGLPFIPITLENLTVTPWVNRATGRLAMSYRATAIRPVVKGKASE